MTTLIVIILFFVQKKQKGFNDKLIEAKINFERELFKVKFETQEHTLQQIARELHDNVCQLLSMAKLNLGILDFERTEEVKNSLPEISEIIESALDDLRDLSRSMNSETIKNGGLIKSIEMQIRILERTGKYNTQFNVYGDPYSMNESKEVILFRILQEALHNTLKHARASNINIALYYDPCLIKLEIKDNGKGFDLSKQTEGPNDANGIHNMRFRAKLMGGKIDIDTGADMGTTITVSTPT